MSDMQQSLIVRKEFYPKACRDNFQSEKQKKPVYINSTYIRFVRADGSEWARPAWERDFQLYKNEYRAYLENKESVATGIPLRELQGVTPAEFETFKELGIVTIEGLAQSSLSQMTDMGERFVALRQYAQTALKTRTDMEQVYLLQQKCEALEVENLRLKSESERAAIPTVKARAEDPVDQETAEDPFFSSGKKKNSGISVEVKKK